MLARSFQTSTYIRTIILLLLINENINLNGSRFFDYVARVSDNWSANVYVIQPNENDRRDDVKRDEMNSSVRRHSDEYDQRNCHAFSSIGGQICQSSLFEDNYSLTAEIFRSNRTTMMSSHRRHHHHHLLLFAFSFLSLLRYPLVYICMCVCVRAFSLLTTNTSSLIIVDESVKSSLVKKKKKKFLGGINQKNVLMNIKLECSLSFLLDHD